MTDSLSLFQKKAELLDYIWGPGTFPVGLLPDTVHENIPDNYINPNWNSGFTLNGVSVLSQLKNSEGNLKQINEFVVNCDSGFVFRMYELQPLSGNGKVIFYIGGSWSRGFFEMDYVATATPQIPYFLQQGYTIVGISQPGNHGGSNTPSVYFPAEDRFITISSTWELQAYVPKPFRFYFEPILAMMNYLEQNRTFQEFNMMGLSSGGWTSLIYPAIDQRIHHSVSIAGAAPRGNIDPSVNLDPKFYKPEFYAIANYTELFMMATYGKGRSFLHVLNKYDPIVFPALESTEWEDTLRNIVRYFGPGGYRFKIDSTINEHGISLATTFLIDSIFFNRDPILTSNTITITPGDTVLISIPMYDDQGDSLIVTLFDKPNWVQYDSVGKYFTMISPGYGIDTMTIKLSEFKGGNSFDYFVITSNNAPSINSIPLTTIPYDSMYRYPVTAIDPDTTHGDFVRYKLFQDHAWLSIDSLTGVISGVAGALNTGTFSIRVDAIDSRGSESQQIFDLTVTRPNTPPNILGLSDSVAVEDSLFQSFIYAGDGDTVNFNETLIFKIEDAPSWLSVDSLTGRMFGIPVSYNVGGTSVTVKVFDGLRDSAVAQLNLQVLHTNHAPFFFGLSDSVAIEDSMFTSAIYIADVDSENYGDTFFISAVLLPSWLTLNDTLNILSGIPSAENVGDTIAVLRVTDNRGAYSDTIISFSILHTNHAPIFLGISDSTSNEDSLFLSQILFYDQDNPRFADTHTFFLTITPAWLRVDSLTGLLSGTPGAINTGLRTIHGKIRDNQGGETHFSFILMILHTNHAPSFVGWSPDTVTVEDELYTQTIRANDQDSALFGDVVRYRLINKPRWLNIDSITGVISGIPRVQNLFDTLVVVEAYDNAGGVTRRQYRLHITHVNHIPEIVSVGSFTAQEDTLYRYQVIAEDPDTLIGDVLIYTLTRRPSWLSVNSSGLISGIPLGKNVGDTIITVRVSDGKGGIASQSYAIKVSHTNHAPVFVTIPDTTAVEDEPYTSITRATDQDSLLFGDKVRYRLSIKPSWLTIDSITGTITGLPAGLNARDTIVAIQAYDNKGGVSTQQYTLKVQHINHEPEFVSIPVSTAQEDSLYTYQVIATDVDQQLFGDTLYYRLRVHPSWMQIDSTTGLITGIPRGKDVGDTVVTVRVRDGKGGLVLQSFAVTVTHTNHAPIFVSIADTIAIEDTLYTYTARASDQDSALFGDIVRYRLSIQPSWISIDSVTGMLSGTPIGVNARDTVLAIQAYDNKGGVSTQQFTLFVQHVNHPPVFVSLPDSSAMEDSLYLGKMIFADQDTMFGDYLRYQLIRGPTWMMIDSVSGVFSGIPSARHVGDTLLTVRATDGGGLFAEQTMSLNIRHTNHPPSFITTTLASATEDQQYSFFIRVTDVDSIYFNDSLIFSLLAKPFWLSINPLTGELSGIPSGNTSADTVIIVHIDDHRGGLAQEQFALSIVHTNHPPLLVIVPPGNIQDSILAYQRRTQAQEDSLYYYQYQAIDRDSEFHGDTLRFALVTSPLWLTIDSVSGVVSGIPKGVNVGDTLYVISTYDGKGGVTAETVYVNILHTNHAPEFVTVSLPSAVEDTLYTFSVWATDVDSLLFGDQVRYSLLIKPTWLTIDSITGTLSGIASGMSAQDTVVSIAAYDNNGGMNSKTFELSVIHTNHSPNIISLSNRIAQEDSLFIGKIFASDVDSLLHGDRLLYQLIVKPSWLTIDSISGYISGVPYDYSVGDTVVTARVHDGNGGADTATFAISVLHTNHAPTFVTSVLHNAIEDSSYLFNIISVDSDSIRYGDDVRYQLLVGPSWLKIDSVSGQLFGTPSGLSVLDTVAVIKVYDNHGAFSIQQFALNIIHTNHSPSITAVSNTLGNEDTLFTSRVFASDVDSLLFGDTLRYQLLVRPNWLSVDSLSGVISGIPRGINVGDTVLTVRVHDGIGGADTATFNVTILHTNHAPVFVNWNPDTVTVEDEVYTQIVRASDQDSALFGDVVRYRLINKPSWLSIDSISGVISGIPRVRNLFDTVVVVEAYDNAGGVARQQYRLHITHVNHIPEIVSIGSFTAQEDTLYRYQVIAEDPDTLVGDVLTYTLSRRPSWLNVSSSGLVTGIPFGKNVGDTIVTVRVSDGKGGIASQSYAIRVSHTNHAPVFVTTVDTTAVEDSLYTYVARASDQDSALFGDVVRYRLSVKPRWLSIDSMSGTITGTPSGLNALDTVVALQAYDNKGGVSTQHYTLKVEHVNHEPEFISSPVLTAQEDSLYRYQASATDIDMQLFGDVLTYSVPVRPNWIQIDSATGLITGIPGGKDVGDTVVTVRVSDGKGGTAGQSYGITISHTNHAPQFVTTADTTAVEDVLYSYTARASDQDSALFGDIVRYRLSIKPLWLTIDSISGTISGTPIGLHAQDTIVAIQAYDNKGGVSTQNYELKVEHVNHPPIFVSLPDSIALEDSAYFYKVLVTDQDSLLFGDNVHFTLVESPWFLSIDSVQGNLSGIPRLVDSMYSPSERNRTKLKPRSFFSKGHAFLDGIEEFNSSERGKKKSVSDFSDTTQYRSFPVSIRAADDKGGEAIQEYRLFVQHTNHNPVFTSTPVMSATEDSIYSYSISVFDIDTKYFGDSLSIIPDALPSWLQFSPDSNLLFGIPAGRFAVDTVVQLKVIDGRGGESLQSFAINVIHVNHSPVIISTADTVAREEFLYTYIVKTFDSDVEYGRDSLTIEFTHLPSWLTYSHDTLKGVPRYYHVGDTVVTVIVVDSRLDTVVQSWNITVTPTYHEPTSFALVKNPGSDTLALDWNKNILFSWNSSHDNDEEDTLQYSLHLWGPSFDTLFTDIYDTTMSAKIMNRLATSSRYFWTVLVTDGRFIVQSIDTVSFSTSEKILGVEEWKYLIPTDYITYQNYPNPFNPVTTIRFGVPKRSEVSIEIYNVIGQRVANLFEQVVEAKYYEVQWDASRFSSGVYYAVTRMKEIDLSGKEHRFIKKLVLIK